MNYIFRIFVVIIFVIMTSIATVKTVSVLNNNKIPGGTTTTELSKNNLPDEVDIAINTNPIKPTDTNSTTQPTTKPSATKTSPVSGNTQISTKVVQNTNTSANVAIHNTPKNCWIIISGKIYNVSSFMTEHPGGASAITPYCGKDATVAFQTKGTTGGSNHSSFAYSLLTSYYVAQLSTNSPSVQNTNQTTVQTNNFFSIGNRIQTSGTLNVRNKANGSLLGKQNPGTTGTVISGPVTSGGYTWWNVNFDSGTDGWVAQNFIKIFSDQITAPPVTDPTNPIPSTQDQNNIFYNLSITKTGSGSGSVSGTSINCGLGCSVTIIKGSVIVLYATPNSDSTFSGWSGACSGTGSCITTLDSNKVVTANFTISQNQNPPPTQGSGFSPSQVSTHNTQNNCWIIISNKVYDVTPFLSQHPGGTSVIVAYCGNDATTVFNTNVSGGHNHSASARAMLPTYYVGDLVITSSTYNLNVIKTGNGSGTVTSSGGGLSCGSICTITNLSPGTSVTLSATPINGSVFTGWTGGGCSGTSTCTFTANSDANITATFTTTSTFTLSLTSTNGSVTSSPSGISCGSTCSAIFNQGASVTLSAIPASGFTFSGWSGACSGTGSCTVTMNSNQSVTAVYTATGGGTTTYTSSQVSTHNTQNNCWIIISNKVYDVTSFISAHPGGANAIVARCGTDSTTVFNSNNGGGHNHSASARAMLPTYYVGDLGTTTTTTFTISINKSGTGTGTVSGGTISCGSTCSANVNVGTSITLTATPATNSTFSGWSGACSGTGSCTVTMNSNQSVTAVYTATGGGGTPVTYTINVTSVGNYDVTNLNLNVGDSIRFVYTPPRSGEVRTTFSPSGISSVTLDNEYTQRTRTFNSAGTWTFKAQDKNGNQGTLIVQ